MPYEALFFCLAFGRRPIEIYCNIIVIKLLLKVATAIKGKVSLALRVLKCASFLMKCKAGIWPDSTYHIRAWDPRVDQTAF